MGCEWAAWGRAALEAHPASQPASGNLAPQLSTLSEHGLVSFSLAVQRPESTKRKYDSSRTPQIWGPPTVNPRFREKRAAVKGPAPPHKRPIQLLLSLVVPVLRASLAHPSHQRSPPHPPHPPTPRPEPSAYPRTGGPSRPPRRAHPRVRRHCSAGTQAERKATGVRSCRPHFPAGAAALTRAGRSVRPGSGAPSPPHHSRGASPRTQVVLVGDGREGLVQAVGAHRQRLALRTALVMAVLAQHHRQLLRRRPVGRVGRERALRAGHGRLEGAPSSPAPS